MNFPVRHRAITRWLVVAVMVCLPLMACALYYRYRNEPVLTLWEWSGLLAWPFLLLAILGVVATFDSHKRWHRLLLLSVGVALLRLLLG